METQTQYRRYKVACPFCGQTQNIIYSEDAVCRGVYVKCKGRHCRQEFEIFLPAQDNPYPYGEK